MNTCVSSYICVLLTEDAVTKFHINTFLLQCRCLCSLVAFLQRRYRKNFISSFLKWCVQYNSKDLSFTTVTQTVVLVITCIFMFIFTCHSILQTLYRIAANKVLLHVFVQWRLLSSMFFISFFPCLLYTSPQAPVWLWTSQWWVKPTGWSQTCWLTPRSPLTPAPPWRLSATSSAPRSASSHFTGPASLRTLTPALTLRRGLKKQRDWPSQR